MLRYVLSAIALKSFSANKLTKKAYRALGNVVGDRLRRSGTYVDTYIQRGNLFRALSEKHNVTPAGGRLLEIGTGWLHWHSVYHRLFNDVEISMLDVWDCRQFGALKAVFRAVKDKISEDISANPNAGRLLDAISDAKDLDELYRLVGLSYYFEPNGALHAFPDESFDCVFSFHVLEHVRRENVEDLASQIHRVLRPNGFSIHQIGIDDHLQHYDGNVSKKNYIRYSDRVWNWLFENDLQYFNRLQASEWRNVFHSGFVELESIPEFCDIKDVPVNKRFSGYSNEDLACVTLTIVHRKVNSNTI